MRSRTLGVVAMAAVLVGACSSGAARHAAHSTRASPPPPSTQVTTSAAPSASSTTSGARGRRWAHVVVVVEENRDASSVLGRSDAPYLNGLARRGLNVTNMHGETHPSQPNYLALLSGSTQGLSDDSCPHAYRGDNLAGQLLRAGLGFVGYAESLPRAGFSGCVHYPYARKHAPWTDFSRLPASTDQPLTALPNDYTRLPALSFVIPNLLHDMHDGTVAQGDAWLEQHLSRYEQWARTHHSLLIVTWDEDEGSKGNHIPTVAVGEGIAPSTWPARADHYSLLATLEKVFGLSTLGHAAGADPITPLV